MTEETTKQQEPVTPDPKETETPVTHERLNCETS